MSLLDEATAEPAKPSAVSVIDALVAKLIAENRADDADEVTELLRAPVVGSTAAARVLTRHFATDAGKAISETMVRRWRESNLS